MHRRAAPGTAHQKEYVMKIAIIGQGNVGSALRKGFTRGGHEARTSNEDNSRQTAAWGEVVVLAVPYAALDEVVRQLGPTLEGKVVIDVTNALTKDMQLALGYSTSGAEELQRKLPKSKVVKAFNTVFAQHMDKGSLNGQPLTVFAAGDDAEARKTVLRLEKDIGFDAVDAGPLQHARELEPMGFFNIQLGYVLGQGAGIGFRQVRA
jgi:8-hydroxy-5-deazaflavin:NADPH oxidoreductase